MEGRGGKQERASELGGIFSLVWMANYWDEANKEEGYMLTFIIWLTNLLKLEKFERKMRN